jgi:hypothetical protein
MKLHDYGCGQSQNSGIIITWFMVVSHLSGIHN